jgi:hypothetical protein
MQTRKRKFFFNRMVQAGSQNSTTPSVPDAGAVDSQSVDKDYNPPGKRARKVIHPCLFYNLELTDNNNRALVSRPLRLGRNFPDLRCLAHNSIFRYVDWNQFPQMITRRAISSSGIEIQDSPTSRSATWAASGSPDYNTISDYMMREFENQKYPYFSTWKISFFV